MTYNGLSFDDMTINDLLQSQPDYATEILNYTNEMFDKGIGRQTAQHTLRARYRGFQLCEAAMRLRLVTDDPMVAIKAIVRDVYDSREMKVAA